MDQFIYPWACWVLIALVFAIMEVALPSFTFSFAAVAALVAAVISLKFGLAFQGLGFALFSFVSILTLRPRLQKAFRRPHFMPSRAEALVGIRGLVTETVDPVANGGRVRVEGHDWAAKSQSKIELNSEILVTGHDGIVLLVKEI